MQRLRRNRCRAGLPSRPTAPTGVSRLTQILQRRDTCGRQRRTLAPIAAERILPRPSGRGLKTHLYYFIAAGFQPHTKQGRHGPYRDANRVQSLFFSSRVSRLTRINQRRDTCGGMRAQSSTTMVWGHGSAVSNRCRTGVRRYRACHSERIEESRSLPRPSVLV
jgi:hypothetical protein